MKNLKVPLFLQPENSVDCGPTNVKMILSYYGIEKELDTLKSQLFYNEIGTSMFDNGYLLLENGLNTQIITANPLLFPKDVIKSLNSQQDIVSYIKIRRNTDKELVKYKDNLNTLDKYFARGGEMSLAIPTFTHIKDSIDKNNPVLSVLNAQVLGSHEGTYHFVIVTGYDDNNVCINNSWPSSQHQAWYPINQFIYAIHCATCADIDNGSILLPSKQS